MTTENIPNRKSENDESKQKELQKKTEQRKFLNSINNFNVGSEKRREHNNTDSMVR